MKRERQSVLSIRVTSEANAKLLGLQAALIVKLGRKVTMTDVIERAIDLLAKREKVGK